MKLFYKADWLMLSIEFLISFVVVLLIHCAITREKPTEKECPVLMWNEGPDTVEREEKHYVVYRSIMEYNEHNSHMKAGEWYVHADGYRDTVSIWDSPIIDTIWDNRLGWIEAAFYLDINAIQLSNGITMYYDPEDIRLFKFNRQ